MTYQQWLKLKSDHLKAVHDLTLYPYQDLIVDRIILSLLHNLKLTQEATEEDIKQMQLTEGFIEISRQAGKTTAVVAAVELIMTFISELYRPVSVGIFAPQIEQARTDFDRLKDALRPIKGLMIQDDEQKQTVKERENAKTLVLPNGSSAWIAPITTTSKPESKTFDVMIFEEAQDINDRIMLESIYPMGANTNAPRYLIGTAGTRVCYFRKGGQKNDAIKLYFDEIVKQRRETYQQTGDARHLIYERTVSQEIEKFGIDSDEIARPYFGKWLIGAGNFMTEEDIAKLETDRSITNSYKMGDCFAGIDTAKHPDSTVVTILRQVDGQKKELINWLELNGENYRNQFEVITSFLDQYKIVAIAIDSTGQGEFMPDWFETETNWRDERSGLYRVKFSQQSKDLMYKNLKVVIQDLLTSLPKLSTRVGERFRQQMLDLQQQYKGQYLSVSHPDDPKAHDDYPDSWALAEWAFAQWNAQPTATITMVEVSKEKERKVTKHEDKVTDYWPD